MGAPIPEMQPVTPRTAGMLLRNAVRRIRHRSPVWRLECVRLGMHHFGWAYTHDWMARHWALDLWWWRLCLIRRHVRRGE